MGRGFFPSLSLPMASSSSYLADFPPLPGALLLAHGALISLNFISKLTKEDLVTGEFSFSFVPPAIKIPSQLMTLLLVFLIGAPRS
ncbi:hypothetical protein MA16_Dca003484 [Dendrobium catenatum]|uniref:Uncharacterized protein n=1 Tax=Dendrobium catenatum TaxID=906689 RepID=A0A2I0WF36_9ASPA|nr:hypothetical protein MA16_Dca003484 [Dendrobium catenatum]